jgi:hypothetical protein
MGALVWPSAGAAVCITCHGKNRVHKRDIMMDRVKEARDTQDDAKKQFLTPWSSSRVL